MFVALCLVFLLCHASAEPDKQWFRCDDETNDKNTSMTFTPSPDGVPGRYTAELCALKNPNWTEWKMELTYNDNLTRCFSNPFTGFIRTRPGRQHSVNTLALNVTNNCTRICYNMDFDLIFSSCYELKSTFKKGKVSCAPYDTYHLIKNNITMKNYTDNKPKINFVNHDKSVSLYWFLGIPPVDYKVNLCVVNNKTGECSHKREVTANCSVPAGEPRALACALAPPHGCYSAEVEHGGPWISGGFIQAIYVSYDFCHYPVEEPVVEVGGAALWWALGGALAGAGVLLAYCALRQAVRDRDYHKRVLNHWLHHREDSVGPVAAPVPDSRPVLLLYAREGEFGEAAVAALKDLVQHATNGPVYDIFSAEVTALCAAAPAAWLRGVLARADVRVLLLQSLATRALYHAPLAGDGAALKLREPLLGRRALYRCPQFGDALLQLALRHVADTTQLHHAYHKYYIATYSELATESLPHVVPFCRYELPGAAAALVRALAGVEAEAGRVLRLRAAVQRLVAHARDHPDFLADELITLDADN